MTAAAALPRVTMIVLAYNQEAFVEAAIAGAFAQDYANLEIILSDDGSADATWLLIERAAAAYRGPHDVLANRTNANRGLLAHIYDAVAKASGELIVVAAGDDVSLPSRVSVLANRWRDSDADALFSDWDVIDEHGMVTGRGGRDGAGAPARWFADGQMTMIAGATAAYSRGLFQAVALPDFPIFIEDYFLSLVLRLRSRPVVHVAERLIQYRAHGGSMVNRPIGTADIVADERKFERFAATSIRLVEHVRRMARDGTGVSPNYGVAASLDLDRLDRDLAHAHFRAAWIDASMARRLAELARQRSTANLRWLLPRLGGIATLRWQRRLTAWWRTR